MRMLSVLVVLFATMAANHCVVVASEIDRSDVLSSVDPDEPTLHTIFSTECNIYFDWQSLGLLYSWRKVGQKGKFTRLMACNKSPPPGTDVVPDTHVHPNYAVHPRTKVRRGRQKNNHFVFAPRCYFSSQKNKQTQLLFRIPATGSGSGARGGGSSEREEFFYIRRSWP